MKQGRDIDLCVPFMRVQFVIFFYVFSLITRKSCKFLSRFIPQEIKCNIAYLRFFFTLQPEIDSNIYMHISILLRIFNIFPLEKYSLSCGN